MSINPRKASCHVFAARCYVTSSGVGGRKREILSSTMRVNDAKQGTLFIENILIALWAGCLFGTLHSVWALMIFLDTPPKPPSPSPPPPYHPAALWDIVVVVIYFPSLIVTIILTLRRRETNVNRRLMKGNETFLATELKSVKFRTAPYYIMHSVVG